jgi:hypothetical protein
VNGRGRIVATIADAAAGETAEVVCTNLDLRATGSGDCGGYYLPGRVVTLRAEPDLSAGPSSLVRWSDDRCVSGPECKIAIDHDDQAVTASFSPQLVTVGISNGSTGPGRITSTPSGLTCDTMAGVSQECSGEFPFSAAVNLTAEGVAPVWHDQCDAIVDGTCSLTVQIY